MAEATRVAARLRPGSLVPRPSTSVLLAEPRGFCAGVEKAIKALAWMVRVFEPPVYCYHEIVHNRLVVDQFREPGRGLRRRRRRGARRGAAHADRARLRPRGRRGRPGPGRRGRRRRLPARDQGPPRAEGARRKGYTVLYVGHAGHEEAVGTMAVAPESVRLLEHTEDLDGSATSRPTGTRSPSWPRPRSATTSGSGLMEAARTRFPDLWMPNRSDLCFATTNRQAALQGHRRRRRRRGGHRLGQLLQHRGAREGGPGRRAAPGCCGSTRRTSCPTTSSGTVGVTAGASAPEALVEAVIARARPADGRRARSTVTTEDEYFPPPPELRELLRAVGATVGFLAAPPGAGRADPAAQDRAVSAADVLDLLAS